MAWHVTEHAEVRMHTLSPPPCRRDAVLRPRRAAHVRSIATKKSRLEGQEGAAARRPELGAGEGAAPRHPEAPPNGRGGRPSGGADGGRGPSAVWVGREPPRRRHPAAGGGDGQALPVAAQGRLPGVQEAGVYTLLALPLPMCACCPSPCCMRRCAYTPLYKEAKRCLLSEDSKLGTGVWAWHACAVVTCILVGHGRAPHRVGSPDPLCRSLRRTRRRRRTCR